ncbi:MAG: hypothetical protein LUE93_02895 [Bacteroides sp.]|nr:hypothetical protein [Bacteroides sp.]
MIKSEEVRVEDQLVTDHTPVEVVWRMLTDADVKEVGGGFLLQKAGKQLQVLLPEGTSPYLSAIEPPNSYDEKSPGVTVIGYRTLLKENVERKMVVRLIPVKP